MAATTQDANVQKRGFVYILSSFEGTPAQVHRMPSLVDALIGSPIRVGAFHFCCSDFSKRDACTESAPYFEAQLLCRSVSHFGTTRQCRNNLLTFGIPLDALPIKDDGVTMDLTYHKQWIERQLYLEEHLCETTTGSGGMSQERPLSSIIEEEPQLNDVVLGRGTKSVNQPGNQRLKRLLEDRLSDFNSARRKEKAAVVYDVYSTMRSEGSRFMLLDISRSKWIEVSDHKALDRIAHGFRNLRLVKKS